MWKFRTAGLIALAAITVAGCIESPTSLAEPAADIDRAAPALRVKADLPRGTRWELGWGAASVYDVAGAGLIRRIPLTGASFAGARETCLPDMVLSRSGALIVSSNAQPVLWRISPARYEVERFDIELDSDKDNDFGFSGLAWGPEERVLYAVSAVMGTLWKIDLESGKASRIALSSPIQGACGLKLATGGNYGSRTPALVVSIGSAAAPQRIVLSPDSTRGAVTRMDATELAALQ